ncbi:MAG: response regulator [Candidatus Andeanibacterium colombiense]|uniref:Response regulator n=1 Tax=Candidatus Andeanibacterium colombiense TaxID=3121345 RepID=A0AAJ6BP15_9SPHN|nr:MAG: response regulator [Sphingomonadaceae bacterium]
MEDELAIGIDLAFAVSDRNGEVAGPVSTVDEAFRALADHPVDAAILDFELKGRDVTPLALHLVEAGIPFVFHTANALPPSIAELCPGAPVLLKPSSTTALMERLLDEIGKRRPPAD